MTIQEPTRRFASVNLAYNVSGIGNVAECNPGGSIICDPGTGGCAAVAMSCAGSSCSNDSSFLGCFTGSDVYEPGINAVILVEQTELEALRTELQNVVARFSGGHG